MRKTAKKKATTKRRVVKKTGAKKARAWTQAQVTMLRKLYRSTSIRDIAKKLKRTASSVQAKASTLGLKKPRVKRASAKKKPVRKSAMTKKTVGKGRRC